MKDEVIQLSEAFPAYAEICGTKLSASEIDLFCHYYELVVRWNPKLHLTTIIDPELFAQRHVAESIFASQHLHKSITKIWDLGSGLGVPGIPIAILRPDLPVTLVEAGRKKSVFLKEVSDSLHLKNVSVLNARFETLTQVERGNCITARALEKMSLLIPRIFKLGKESTQFLILAGPEIRSELVNYLPQGLTLESMLLPFSINRWLLSLIRFT